MNALEAVNRTVLLESRNNGLRYIVDLLKDKEDKDLIWAIYNENKKEINKLEKALRDIKVELD